MKAPCGHASVTAGCRFCSIAARDARYLALFFGPHALPVAAPFLAPPQAACRHLGGPTGETTPCRDCTRKGTLAKVFSCAEHGRCTLEKRSVQEVACCRGCAEYAAPEAAPPRSFPVRHCLYHVCPLASGAAAWRRCCVMLSRRAELFTGRRLVAASVGPGTEPASAVRLALPDFDVIEVANDPKLRESKTLPLMLARIDPPDPSAAVFFGHAKGVTRPENRGVTCHPWAWLLHEILLDYWPLVEESLSSYPITGACKKVGRGFAGSPSAWHYSGAFFWARAEALRGRRVEQKWFGAESSPGAWFAPHEAGCLFGEGRVPELDLYRMERLKELLLQYQWWRQEHEAERTKHDREVLGRPG